MTSELPAKLPSASPPQRRALIAGAELPSGRVYATRATIGALMRAGLVTNPMYRYSRGHSWAELTELGRAVAVKYGAQIADQRNVD